MKCHTGYLSATYKQIHGLPFIGPMVKMKIGSWCQAFSENSNLGKRVKSNTCVTLEKLLLAHKKLSLQDIKMLEETKLNVIKGKHHMELSGNSQVKRSWILLVYRKSIGNHNLITHKREEFFQYGLIELDLVGRQMGFGVSDIDVWKEKIKRLKKTLKGWHCNVEGAYKKTKKELIQKKSILGTLRVNIAREKQVLKGEEERLEFNLFFIMLNKNDRNFLTSPFSYDEIKMIFIMKYILDSVVALHEILHE
ncbi:hypothetical protein ACJX0J_027114, partial [Zea mays]